MFKKKATKIVFVLTCLFTLVMPHFSVVLAALNSSSQTANLKISSIREGGDCSEELNENQLITYDTKPYAYKIGDVKVFKIVTATNPSTNEITFDDAWYCVDSKKEFPGTVSGGVVYNNIADFKNSLDVNVRRLKFTTDYATDQTTWNKNHKAVSKLLDIIYLKNQAPEQRDEFLSKAFADYTVANVGNNSGVGDTQEETLENVKGLLTDDDIDVVQQKAIWYFTNHNDYTSATQSETYGAESLSAITVEDINGNSDSLNNKTGGNWRVAMMNHLYKYLIAAAQTEDTSADNKYPELISTGETVNYNYSNYFVFGPFKVKAGEEAFTVKIKDQNGNEIQRGTGSDTSNNKYLVFFKSAENEITSTDQDINEITGRDYYIGIPKTNTSITTLKYEFSYSKYETEATLWKSDDEDNQPVVLVIRKPQPQKTERTFNILRSEDLALTKTIIKLNDRTIQRKQAEPDVSKLKAGTESTADYKYDKTALTVKPGDRIVYEIRVYNEGMLDATGMTIYDTLPKGLELATNSSVNNTYGWTKVSEGTKSTTYKTEYLASTKINAFNTSTGALSSVAVQIECVVSSDIKTSVNLKNVAEIAADNIGDRDSHPGENEYTIDNDKDPSEYTGREEDDDDYENINVQPDDLALKKYIVKVNNDSVNRKPSIDVTALKNGTDATYTHSKTPVGIRKGDVVVYEIRVYNEGEGNASGVIVYDTVPLGLELATSGEGGNINTTYGWTRIRTGSQTATYKSEKLSSETITGFNKTSGTAETLENNSKYVQIAFVVTNDFDVGEKLTNVAEIAADNINDRDSTPENNPYTENNDNLPNPDDADREDDDDYETIIILPDLTEDLALVKSIVKVNNETKNRKLSINVDELKAGGTGATYNYSKEPITVKPGDKIVYEIRVFNEGEVDTTGVTVFDTLPKGLELAENSSINTTYGWTKVTEGTKSVTYKSEYLKNAEISKFDKATGTQATLAANSKYVQIECVVKSSIGANLKNVAEIATDNLNDIDSNPGENPYTTDNSKDPIDYTKEQDDDDYENIVVQVDDLALRKYVQQMKTGNTIRTASSDKAMTIDVSKLKNGTATTAEYKQAKTPEAVYPGDVVTYTIRVFNEGERDASGVVIYDTIPNGLEILSADESSVNRQYGWVLVSEGDKTKTYKSEALKNVTITKFDKATGTAETLENNSKYVQIECRVKTDVSVDSKLTNVAEIVSANISDIDSTPSNNRFSTDNSLETANYTGNTDNKPDLTDKNYHYKGEEDDDDFATVVVKIEPRFDLNLKKYATEINRKGITPSRIPADSAINVDPLINGTATDATYPESKTAVEVNVGDIVKYTIRVYNEGNVAGYAEEVSDFLPEGLGFLYTYTTNQDNLWEVKREDGKEIKTIKLSDIPNATKNLSLSDFTNERKLDDIEVITGKNIKLVSTKLSSRYNSLINAFDKNTKKLDYKDIYIVCVVLNNASSNNLRNISEVIKELDENKNPITDIDSTPDTVNPGNYPDGEKRPDGKKQDDNDYEDLTTREPDKFDLSLKKFITKVNSTDVKDREPQFVKDSSGKISIKSPDVSALKVENNDVIIYTIRVYNEGNVAGYAAEISDNMPKGLIYLPTHEVNKKYEWKMYDKSGNVVQKVEEATTLKTEYLSKESSEKRNENNLLNPYTSGETRFDYRDVQLAFLVDQSAVDSSRKIKNIAEISKDTDKDGKDITDIDSTPGNGKTGEDDIDDEEVYVKYFDLSLKKDLIKIIITEDGKTREIAINSSNDLAKVEIHRKKINTTIVKFVYRITVKNEGEIDGYATEIKDYVPDGLIFEAGDNPQWKSSNSNVITTDALAKTLLKPGNTASVDVTFKWKNSEDNLGKKTNIAEISKDENNSNTPDRDSTPDNKNPNEDDYDTAEVFLAVSTGKAPTYLALTFTILAIMATGITLIKKFVLQ